MEPARLLADRTRGSRRLPNLSARRVCVFSTTRRFRGTCGVYGVAVKDGRKRLQASNVSAVQIYRGDPADCDPQAFMDYPSTLKGGIRRRAVAADEPHCRQGGCQGSGVREGASEDERRSHQAGGRPLTRRRA